MRQIEVAGIPLDLEVHGDGSPILYLHGEHHYDLQRPFLARLAERGQVFSPRHPGFDGRAPPSTFRRVDDLAYLYLDLLEQLDLRQVAIVGSSLGGWIALEMAVRGCPRARALTLLGPLGAKLGGRESREYADIFALPDAEAAQALFAGPPPDLAGYSEQAMTELARDRQYLAYYGWKPYLHNPGLARWLHRVRLPSLLVWGEGDGLVSPSLRQALAERLSHAEVTVLEGAGHYPQIEQPDATFAAWAAWCAGTPSVAGRQGADPTDPGAGQDPNRRPTR